MHMGNSHANQDDDTSPQGMPFIVTLSSAQERKGGVFERAKDHEPERPLAARWVSAMNNAQGEDHNSTLDRLGRKAVPRSFADLKSVLAHDDIMASSNIYSIVFDYSNNRMLLASGKIPAAVQEFRQSKLFGND
jgi:hypothetical protein